MRGETVSLMGVNMVNSVRRRRIKLVLRMFVIMKDKWLSFAVLAAFLVLVINSGSEAVSTREIDVCCHKEVLDDGDLQIIDDFVADAVDELVKTKDFTSIARIRTVIIARSSSSTDSAKAQYAAQFSESAQTTRLMTLYFMVLLVHQ